MIEKLVLIFLMLSLVLAGCSEKQKQGPTDTEPPKEQIVINEDTPVLLPFSPSNEKLTEFEAVPLVTGNYLTNVGPYIAVIEEAGKSIRFAETDSPSFTKMGYVTYNKIIYSGNFAIDDRNNAFEPVHNLKDCYSELQISPDTSILLFDDKLIMQKLPSGKEIKEFQIQNGYEPGTWRSTLYPAPSSKYLGHISCKITDGSQPYNIRIKDFESAKIYNFPFVQVPYQDDFKIYGLVADKDNIIWVAYNVKADWLKTDQYNNSYLQAYRFNPEQDEFEMIDKKELPGHFDFTIYPADDGIEILWITEKQKNKQLEQWNYYFNKATANIE